MSGLDGLGWPNPEDEPKTSREKAALGPSDATTCSLEVEISESKRRYITIEVTPEMADRICEWTMKYNPTAAEEQAAIDAVKAAKVIKEEVMHDTYEIGSVDFPENAEVSHGDGSATPQ
jgi:hypothetical protein